MAFGVPPMLLGLPGDATYANYREANRALWRLTVLPLCAKILGAISQGLAGWFEGADLRVDMDRVPALAEDRMALWREVSGADWLTAARKSVVMGKSVSVRVEFGGRRIIKKKKDRLVNHE